MTEKDFERIGQLIDSRLELMESRFNVRFEQIDAKFSAKFEELDARLAKVEAFKDEIISEFNHSLGIKTEELSRLFKVAAEGHAALVERLARLEERVESGEAKIEKLSLELLVQRLHPDRHGAPSGDRVKEEEAGFVHLDPFHQFDPEFRKRLLDARKSLDERADEVRAYCAEKGIELPRGNTEAMIRLIQECRKHRVEVEQELKKR